MVDFGPDELDAAAFTALMAPLFEEAPRYLHRLSAARPFGSWEALFAEGKHREAQALYASHGWVLDNEFQHYSFDLSGT